MQLQFYPYDFEYKVEEGKTFFYLYGRTKEGQRVAVKHQYQPFFYAAAAGIDKQQFEERVLKLSLKAGLEPAQVMRVEIVTRYLLGKRQEFYKVFANYPKAVPLLAKEVQNWGISTYEKDILYAHRYLRDHNITPMKEVTATGDFLQNQWMRVPVFAAEKVEQQKLETLPDWRILAIDLETYAEKREIDFKHNPILMAGFYGMKEGKEFRKVITWNGTALPEYVEMVQDEAALLQRVKEVILEFHPDMLKFIRNIFGKDLDVETYSLDAVSRQLLNHQKHRVELDQLSFVWDNRPERLAEYCAYNLHDSFLAYKLCEKLLPDMIEF